MCKKEAPRKVGPRSFLCCGSMLEEQFQRELHLASFEGGMAGEGVRGRRSRSGLHRHAGLRQPALRAALSRCAAAHENSRLRGTTAAGTLGVAIDLGSASAFAESPAGFRNGWRERIIKGRPFRSRL